MTLFSNLERGTWNLERLSRSPGKRFDKGRGVC